MSLFESMPYEVEKKEKNIEIRHYKNVLLASTSTQMNERLDSGFSNVFRYISGENKEKSKISMTTPVVSYEEKDKLVTGFYVPKKYTKETVPKPQSDNVYIQELKSSLYAVISFRGSWTDKNFDKYDESLKKFIEEHAYNIVSPRLIFRYQPPFIPGIFRHNEIAYQIESETNVK
jgi:hypothetical protein